MNACQAAAMLGVSARQVYDLAAPTGPIPCTRIGRRVIFEESDVLEFKAQSRCAAAPPVESPSTPPAPPAAQPWEDPTGPLARHLYGLTGRAPTFEMPAPLTAWQKRRIREARERRRQEDLRALRAFHSNKRRAARLSRTPPWADLDAMRAIYALAQRLTRETGVLHHVDHIVPLQGRYVSGLHVENNLQVLTGPENIRKHNRYEVEA